MRALAFVMLLAVTATATALPQGDTQAIATALVRAQAPAADDADAIAAELVAQALVHRRSPAASLLIGEAGSLVASLQEPARLLAQIEADGTERRHGLLDQSIAVLRWRLVRSLRGPAAAGPFPTFGHCDELLVCGPFSDGGDHFVGVPFAPELEFPAAGAELPARGLVARTFVAKRRTDERRIDLAAPPRRHAGCHYARFRVAAKADVEAFVEIEHEGDWQLFAGGAEIARCERWREEAPGRQFVSVVVPAGVHDFVFKAATGDQAWVSLRFVDGDGRPVEGIESVPATEAGADAAAAAPAKAGVATFVTGVDALVRAARAAGADDIARVAALIAAVRDDRGDLAIDLADGLRSAPPADAATALAFARVLRQVPLPDELRKAEARKLEERAAAELPAEHHQARLAKASHLEEQDQREDALRLLLAHPAPGAETFARRLELLRALKFNAEVEPLLRAWSTACPRDARPLAQRAGELAASGDQRTQFDLRQRSLALRPDQPAVARAAFHGAVAMREFELAAELLDLIEPRADATARLFLQLDLATARDDDATADTLRRQLAAHPETTSSQLVDLAGRWTRRGERSAAIECLERAIAIGGTRPSVHAWLDRLQGSDDDAEAAPHRRDGKAAAAAFFAGEREQGASTTLLIDQCVLTIAADGSWNSEVHQLRRINDQAGVDMFSQGAGIGGQDEVLLVRTLGTDGKEYVPSRIDGDYAMQRLEPGAFVEWRWREHSGEPGPGALTSTEFMFGSPDEPAVLTELIVVAPPQGRGELRTRSLGEPTATSALPDGRTVRTWLDGERPSLKKERFLPGLFDLLPCAQFGEDDAPFATLREQRVQLWRRTRPTAPLRDAAKRITADASGDRAAADLIWSYCQREIENGNSDVALDTLLRKKGSRFLLAVALLRAAGITVAPMAATEMRDDFGDGPQTLFATEEHLQLPAALVTLSSGERLPFFVDAPRHWPLGEVPSIRGGTTAIVLHDDRNESIVLAASNAAAQSIHVRGEASVRGRDLVLNATAVLGDVQGYSLAERLRQQKENVQQLAARQITQQLFSGWRVEKARLVAQDPSKPFTVEATLTRGGAQRSGERFVVPVPLPPNKLTAMLGDRAERTLPWRLPVDLDIHFEVTFDPGPDMRVVRCPPPVALREASLRFTQEFVPASGRVTCRRSLRVVPAELPAARFADWLRTLAAADRAEHATIELLPRAPK